MRIAGRPYHIRPVGHENDPQPIPAMIDGMETGLFLNDEMQAIGFLAAAESAGELPPVSLLLLLTDDRARLQHALGVDDVPDDPPQDERIHALTPMLCELGGSQLCCGVLLAIGRYGDPTPRGGDFGWHDAVHQAAATASLDCHGAYVVTPFGVRRVRPLAAPPGMLTA